MTHENDTSEQLPSALIDQLKSTDQPDSLITSRVDREILQLAESQFSSRRAIWHRRPAWVAIAASVLVAFIIVQLREPAIVDGEAIYADVDLSGQIDIADVLALARTRGNGEKSQAELDAFAMRIVSLAAPEETS